MCVKIDDGKQCESAIGREHDTPDNDKRCSQIAGFAGFSLHGARALTTGTALRLSGPMGNSTSPELPGTLSAAVMEARALVASDPVSAESWAREILNFAPGQPHAVALLANARRQKGDLGGARDMLLRLAEGEPNLASIQYELGIVLTELGDRSAAISALEQAVALEPMHPLASRALNDLRSDAARPGDVGQWSESNRESLRKELMAIDPAARPGKEQLPAVERDLNDWLALHPTDVTSRRMLAGVLFRLGRKEEAEKQLEEAVRRSPGFAVARWQLVKSLMERNAYEEALPHADLLCTKDPEDSEYLNCKADVLMRLRQFSAAIQCYEQLLSKHPTPENWMFYGHALKAVGRTQDCIAAYRHAIQLRPAYGQAYWSLANMKTFRFEPADIAAMERALMLGEMNRDNRAQMHFALGKALEDVKQFGASFEQYRNGNSTWREGVQHDADDMRAFVRRSKAVFTAEFLRKNADVGSPAPDPIFVVGLPRSGSSLVEQILASHSQVEGIGEVTSLNTVAEGLADYEHTQGKTYPEILLQRSANDFRKGGDQYIALTRAYRQLDRPFFIDKMPGNFHHLGLLLLILPKAKVIDARRHPLATGFANFRQFYPQAQSFAFNLSDIGRYYHDYAEMMAHFDAVLPGRIHRVFHERMVTNTEEEIRRLLDHCGLPFEENCLRFHKTERAVLTASSEQVRRPIFTEGIDQWRNYEAWLGPMKAALGPVLDAYPGVPNFDTPLPVSWSLGSRYTPRYQWISKTPPVRTDTR